METTAATPEAPKMTATRRFDSLADAFEYSVTAGGLIFASGHPERTMPARNYVDTDFYVIDFAHAAAVEAAAMRIVTDFSDLM